MEQEQIVSISSSSVSPGDIASKQFPVVKRGFDVQAVKTYLQEISSELKTLLEREATLISQIQMLEKDLSRSAESESASVSDILGHETAKILDSARESAQEIVKKAELKAAKILAEAENLLQKKSQEAEKAQEKVLSAANLQAEKTLAEAKDISDETIRIASEQSRQLIEEAKAVRNTILGDLVERRRKLREQVQQLVAARDVLFETVLEIKRHASMAEKVLEDFEPKVKEEARSARNNVVLEGDPDEKGLIEEAKKLGLNVSAMVEELDKSLKVRIDNSKFADNQTEIDENEIGPGAGEEHIRIVGKRQEKDISQIEADDKAEGPEEDVIDSLFSKLKQLGNEKKGRASTEQPETEIKLEDLKNVVVRRGQSAITDKSEFEFRVIVDEKVGAPKVSDNDASNSLNEASEKPNVSIDEKDSEEKVLSEDSNLQKAGLIEVGPETLTGLINSREDELLSVAAALSRRAKRFLTDELNALLDRIRKNPHVEDLESLVSFDQQTAQFASHCAPFLYEAFKVGQKALQNSFPEEVKKSVAVDGSPVDQLSVAICLDILKPLRKKVEDALGKNDPELTGLGIHAAFREWKGDKLETLVMEACRKAYHTGIVNKVNPQVRVSWFQPIDKPCCADCEDNSLSDPVEVGSNFISGHSIPPAHDGCMCIVLPAGKSK